MEPSEYIQKTEVVEADDSVMSTETHVTRDGFSIMPTLRSEGRTSIRLKCLGHNYDIPLECRGNWMAVQQFVNVDGQELEF